MTHELPEWLTLHQAVAWVRYRDVSELNYRERSVQPAVTGYGPPVVGNWVTRGADADHLAALAFGGKPPLAGMDDLQEALASGRLTAHGAKEGFQFEAIAPIEWTRLEIVPRDPSRQHPYEVIRVGRDDLLRAFPSMPISTGRNLPNLSDAALRTWWDGLSPTEHGKSLDALWKACKTAHADHHVSRQRVRDLSPGRKTGPKPLSQKATA